ncbi:unnamed protein product [Gongylonema pulchrum]|uniref:Uncharacterized protein n=1 Tax=Gongylonema pulchrum TaxID=637853 RepID=A0A183EKY8_9BILA|nr:unnamed protein product [Gongylonema pulchrum]
MTTFPSDIAQKEPIPSDRVAVVLPQDNFMRYRDMNLRNRRNDSSKNGVARVADANEGTGTQRAVAGSRSWECRVGRD